MAEWTCGLELDAERRAVSGSEAGLTIAFRRGADLRVYTQFGHDQKKGL